MAKRARNPAVVIPCPSVATLCRRAFIRDGASCLAALTARGVTHAAAADEPPVLRIGLLTDLHYADRPPAGTRHYRETTGKMRTAIDYFNEAKASVAIELGDFIDEAPTTEAELVFLRTIETEFARFKGGRHYVLGNHCVSTLTKDQFYDHCAARRAPYSFDQAGFHFVVLDACHRADGVSYGAKNFQWTDTEIPEGQREWLRADLASTLHPTLVFVHQRLDVAGNYGVKSAPAVRAILEMSGRVLAVFQGHNHVNDHRTIGGVHYCTLPAMVEGPGPQSSAYGLLEVFANGRLKVNGFLNQKNHHWPRSA